MNISRRQSLIFSFLMLLLPVWIPAQSTVIPAVTHETGVKPHEGIDAIYQRFQLGYEKLDAEMVAGLYTDDALYLVPDNDVMRGKENIRKNFSVFFDYNRNQGRKLNITFRILRRSVQDELGYDVGIYTLQSSKDGKVLGEDQGKFVVVSRKMKDGAWKFELDSYSGLKSPERK